MLFLLLIFFVLVVCISNPKLLIFPSLSFFDIRKFVLCAWESASIVYIDPLYYFLDSACDWYLLTLCLCLTHFAKSNILRVHPCCCKRHFFILLLCWEVRASQAVLMLKNPPASAGDMRGMGSVSGQEDPLEEGTATHFSILAWKTPWTEEPGGLQSVGPKRVRHDLATTTTTLFCLVGESGEWLTWRSI